MGLRRQTLNLSLNNSDCSKPVMRLEIVSRSEAQTAALARGVAKLLRPGDVVFLTGPLGAGKTFFVRHAAFALGVLGPVTSPSFTMAQTYEGEVRVHHLDLYRLSGFTAEDVVDFEPFFEGDAITFIEWPEQAESFLTGPALTIRLDHVDLDSRRISLESRNQEMNQGLEQLLAGTGD